MDGFASSICLGMRRIILTEAVMKSDVKIMLFSGEKSLTDTWTEWKTSRTKNHHKMWCTLGTHALSLAIHLLSGMSPYS